jgi:hypothetical protein
MDDRNSAVPMVRTTELATQAQMLRSVTVTRHAHAEIGSGVSLRGVQAVFAADSGHSLPCSHYDVSQTRSSLCTAWAVSCIGHCPLPTAVLHTTVIDLSSQLFVARPTPLGSAPVATFHLVSR